MKILNEGVFMKKQVLASLVILGLTTTAFAKSLECTVTKPDGSVSVSSDVVKDSPKGPNASLDLGTFDGRAYSALALSGSTADDKPTEVFITEINFSDISKPAGIIVNNLGGVEMLSTYLKAQNQQGQVRVKCVVK
jgi:hypothetical protein